jgi:glycosyltransferase involved in cell wall biosynthesis
LTGYAVRMPSASTAPRPRVLHIIPNFMTGGSSRLVVDLIERLGDRYEQGIVTSHVPTPAAYRGPRVIELRQPADSRRFIEVFKRERPDFLHVHWWGDCDTPWYQAAFEAAAQLGIPIIENINTPIAPWVANEVKHYVYVSDQVRLAWGQGNANESTLHPGSDFSMFRRSSQEAGYGRCVGMVYRLERDKLDEAAIEPLIRALQSRADAQALIVGGGSLLTVFRDKVTQAGVADRVEFTGYVPYEALPDLYRRMAVFVAPVRKESFGQVSPFAMSMEVPVCGYDVDALSEVIGDASMLAPAGDADRLAEIVVGILDSPERRAEKAAQQCRRARERFSVEAMVQGYEQLYAHMVNLGVAA